MTARASLVPWILANAVGMALGFLTFLQTLNFLSFGLNFDLHWSEEAIAGLEDPERLLRLGLVIGLPLAGAVLAGCQAWALRGRLSDLWQWVLCGPAGFGAMILVVWPLTAVWGDIPGPVEPFTIVGGGLLTTGLLQWLLLRRRGVQATRWLVLWFLGLPLGMVVFMLAYTLLDAVITPGEEYSIGWAAEVALIGFFVGGTAGMLSGRALLGPLGRRSSPRRGPETADEEGA